MSEDNAPQHARRWHQGYEEVAVAALFLVGTIYFRLRIEDFVLGREGGFLGPEFWPATLLTIAIVLSAAYLVLAVIWVRRQDTNLALDRAATTSAPAHVPAGQPAGSSGGATAAAAPQRDARASAPADEHAGEDGSVAKLVGGFVLLAAYIYLLGPIGFVPATVLFSIGFMMLVGERRWYVLLVFPVAAVTVLLGIFTQLLVVSLPRGTGFLVDLSTYLY